MQSKVTVIYNNFAFNTAIKSIFCFHSISLPTTATRWKRNCNK